MDDEGRKQPFIQNKHNHDDGKDALTLSHCLEPCTYCSILLDELLGHMLNVYANEGRFVECPSTDDACDVRDRCAPHIFIYLKTSIFFPLPLVFLTFRGAYDEYSAFSLHCKLGTIHSASSLISLACRMLPTT